MPKAKKVVKETTNNIRKLGTSLQTKIRMSVLGFKKGERLVTEAYLPNDKPSCKCDSMKLREQQKIAQMNDNQRQSYISKRIMHCQRTKEADMKPYKIICNNCGEHVANVYSIDESLSDWCDFHYINATDGEHWYGAITPNVNPYDYKIGIECACGIDTRKINSEGREFGQKDSKFKLVPIQ